MTRMTTLLLVAGVAGVTGIVGGDPASDHEFPFSAAITWQGFVGTECGGSIIGEEWVLTAAHCLYQNDRTDEMRQDKMKIQVGNANLADSESLQVAEMIPHPLYVNTDAKTSGSYDVALIRLKSPLDLFESGLDASSNDNPSYRRRLLASDKSTRGHKTNKRAADRADPAANQLVQRVLLGGKAELPLRIDVTLIGWGLKRTFGQTGSKNLRKIETLTGSEQECKREAKGRNVENAVCVGGMHPEKDSCSGDSGSPGLWRVSDQTPWKQFGVTSFAFGQFCAGSTWAWYADVEQHLQWISRRSGLSEAYLTGTSPLCGSQQHWFDCGVSGDTGVSVALGGFAADPNPRCIPVAEQCDGVSQCANGADEDHCGVGTSTGQQSSGKGRKDNAIDIVSTKQESVSQCPALEQRFKASKWCGRWSNLFPNTILGWVIERKERRNAYECVRVVGCESHDRAFRRHVNQEKGEAQKMWSRAQQCEKELRRACNSDS